jgi:DNA-directed RNA polymerase sigma subunit (sigma70/sigma32)
VQRAIHSSEYVIRLPSNIQESLSKIRKNVEELEKELSRSPKASEIAERCSLSIEEVTFAMSVPKVQVSLDATGADSDRPSPLIELVCDDLSSNTVEDAETRIQLDRLRSTIDNCLDEVSKFVIIERMKDPPTAWKKLASITGIGITKLKQIEESAINRCSILVQLESQL